MATPFGKKKLENLESVKPEEAKARKIDEENNNPQYLPERKEETGYYNTLRAKLEEMQKGGVDLHFGQIDVDGLSTEALELYRKHVKKKLTEEKIRKFMENTSGGSDDYNFAAMLLNWQIAETVDEKYKSKEINKGK
ncbi:MAG TPA: hypothetical protein ENH35_00775 [Candidatus Moranbacteria bacterium]|nr:hypothetical protein [Candidatus Moranbacteria bacterium]